jgi:probable dihydroxyacetone kinase regulator
LDAKKIFSATLISLIETHSFNDVTVEMILKESTLSRATFYRYFRDKFDLLNWYYQTHLNMLEAGNYSSWKEFVNATYRFLYDRRKYFAQAFKVAGDNAFFNYLFDACYSYCEQAILGMRGDRQLGREDKLALEYYLAGQLHTSKVWLLSGAKEDPEELAAWSYAQTPKDFLACFEHSCQIRTG